MGHWQVIACILGALAGVIVFLSLVTHELVVFERALEFRRKIEKEKEARRQQQDQ